MTDEVKEYCDDHTTPESPLIKKLVNETKEKLQYHDMMCGVQIGRLLSLLVKMNRIRSILEIGTFTGYSAMMMADALPEDGLLTTLEVNERYREISSKYFAQEPYNKKIRQIMGDALETIPILEMQFDMIFIDADKISYPDYFKLTYPKLQKGGVLVVDNTLWGNEVISPDDPKSKSVDRLNRMIRDEENLENVMLPVRDGLIIARKRG